jgi:hypothetical protein
MPVLLGLMFLIGWLPTFLLYRARVWAMRRRIDAKEAQPVPAVEPAPLEHEHAPVI